MVDNRESEIIIYQREDENVKIYVKFEDETV